MKTMSMLAVVFVAMLFVACATPKFGSRQADGQVEVLEEEISLTQDEISDLETQAKDFKLSFQKKDDLKQKIVVKIERLEALQSQRNYIVDSYTRSTEVPKELSSRELDQRKNSFAVRRQEMLLEKISNNIHGSRVDSSNGYKVVLDNNYYKTIVFDIVGNTGGDHASVVLRPKEKRYINLIPDTYTVKCLEGGRQLSSRIMTIDGSMHDYKGEKCFNFAFVTR